MRLIFAGTPEVAIPSLDAIHASGHELLAVLTRPDAPARRGQRLTRSPVGAWADAHGVEVLTPTKPADPRFVERLTDLDPDCVPVVGYGALVPPSLLEQIRYGWVNLHFSLLPAWRGASPVQHAIMHGDEVTGASVFQLEKGLDTGPVFGTLTESIRPRDTTADLLTRLATGGAGLLLTVLDAIADGTAVALAQPADGPSYAAKLTADDARVRWSDPAFAVDRRVRACTPAPGPWTTFRDERIKLGRVTPAPDDPPPGPAPSLAPGEIAVSRRDVRVGTATDPVLLTEVQAPGRRPMPATDWARGARVSPGERFA